MLWRVQRLVSLAFIRPYQFAKSLDQESCAQSPIADGQSPQTAGRKREVQDEDPLVMVPSF